ncbi:hypothetical protein SCHAM137S_05895 [Streptomyces chartreusis]
MCAVELQKLRHDRTELYTRAVQPALWLLIFGQTFTRIKAIPTGGIPYVDYLAPGIIAQSAMFIAIFYGIQIIWERDAGVLNKLLVTPTPRSALITGKAFAAGVKALVQAVVVIVIAALLGVALTWNPLKLLGVAAVVVHGSAFFACLSMTIAGIVLSRDRLGLRTGHLGADTRVQDRQLGADTLHLGERHRRVAGDDTDQFRDGHAATIDLHKSALVRHRPISAPRHARTGRVCTISAAAVHNPPARNVPRTPTTGSSAPPSRAPTAMPTL